jgi:RNA polymerase sigma-70 factor, ECF subfamily
LNDRQLVKKLLAKDEVAYRVFFETYRDRIFKACVYILGYQDPEAEDIAQETFLVAIQRLPQFEFRSSLYHWLHCICTYLCFERVRARKRLLSSLNEDLEMIAGTHAVRRHHRAYEEKNLERMLDVVDAQKGMLGDPCRNLLELRDNEKKSYAELAEIFKVPVGTITSRLARCKEALKSLVSRALKEVSVV